MHTPDLYKTIECLRNELQKEKENREADMREYLALEREYEKEINSLRINLANAKGKIISQSITLESYKNKIGVPIIVEGKEKDLYKGEQKDFILQLIRNAMNDKDKYTRSYEICKSLLSANNETGTRQYIKNESSKIFRNYSGFNATVISKLEDLGFRIISEKGHYKLILGNDDRHSVSISHSPSDIKSGLNIISDINKIFF